jgi:hypothetical protein
MYGCPWINLLLRLVSVAGSSANPLSTTARHPLDVTARWSSATGHPRRCGSGTRRQGWHLLRAGATVRAGVEPGGSAQAVPSALPPAVGVGGR